VALSSAALARSVTEELVSHIEFNMCQWIDSLAETDSNSFSKLTIDMYSPEEVDNEYTNFKELVE